MNEPTKQNPVASLVEGVKKHKTKILAVTAVASIAANVAQARGISAHNAFLKEHGLFEQFYNLTDEA